MDNLAIRVEDVCKVYKLYDKPSDRLKDALGLVRKNHFKEHHALKHVSFEVKKGETIGIIGTNGSRKIYHFKNNYRCFKSDERRGGNRWKDFRTVRAWCRI